MQPAGTKFLLSVGYWIVVCGLVFVLVIGLMKQDNSKAHIIASVVGLFSVVLLLANTVGILWWANTAKSMQDDDDGYAYGLVLSFGNRFFEQTVMHEANIAFQCSALLS